jgi:ParB family transcriptional regulator, chromosome partitioning protein
MATPSTAAVELIDPRKLQKNKDNPRLIFRQDELKALEDSIRDQGILVPLTVFRDGSKFTLLDGERRWRCALRLGLHQIPAIVQAKPDRVTNIMMMFAIHNARQDWDPLPAALKLEELEKILEKANGSPPSEKQLAAAASLSLGVVRRFKKILDLPDHIRNQLLQELDKPRSEQVLTVDHGIEAVAGASRLAKSGAIDEPERVALVRTMVTKFRSKVLQSTVEPRKLSRIARAVERQEISPSVVQRQIRKFNASSTYTIDDVFRDTVESTDFSHGTEQLIRRSLARLDQMRSRKIAATNELRELLVQFVDRAKFFIK